MAAISSIPSTGAATIVFPPPPPTTNTLTPSQRAHLRKSTKKLGQILGATPQLIDADIISMLGPVHIQLPSGISTPSSGTLSPVSSRTSSDSSSSSLWSSFHSISYSGRSSPELKHSISRKASLPSLHSSKLSNNLNSFSYQIPAFQIVASPSPSFSSLSTTNSSPSSSPTLSERSTTFSRTRSLSRSSSVDDFDSTDMHLTLRPTRCSTSSTTSTSTKSSSDESFFQIPASSAARRQKMNRLKKMLGEDVPVHLVFPEDKENYDGKNLNTFTRSGRISYKVVRPATPFPPGVTGSAMPRPKKANSGRIDSARDSTGSISPHRAPKKFEKEKMMKRTTVSMISPPLPIPSPPTIDSVPIPIPIPIPQEQISQKQLCSIAESPDENGTTSVSVEDEDFRLAGLAANAILKSQLEHVDRLVEKRSVMVDSQSGAGKTDGGAAKVWNRRRGYSGWDMKINSMVIEKTEQDRKRSMSYRKPPPPIDF